MKETKQYWVDGNNNCWSKEKYSKETAMHHSQNLINCYDCIDCRHLRNCKACIKSSHLQDCYGCIKSRHCNHCIDCEKCVNCMTCTGLSHNKNKTGWYQSQFQI